MTVNREENANVTSEKCSTSLFFFFNLTLDKRNANDSYIRYHFYLPD